MLNAARKLLFLRVFSLALLAGCTTLPEPASAPGGYSLRGKLGVIEAADSFSARFLWHQQAADFTIDLWGPLGQGRVRLEGDARQLAVLDAGGELITRGPHRQVMEAQLGWSLPLEVLPQWVQGRPDPALPFTGAQRDAAGRFSRFEQLGWQVELEGYEFAGVSGGEPAPLPHRVTASKGAYRVRLAISAWQF